MSQEALKSLVFIVFLLATEGMMCQHVDRLNDEATLNNSADHHAPMQ